MKSKRTVKAAKAFEGQGDDRDDASPQAVLAMLESLVDALDAKAEQVEGAGESDDEETRARTMMDVADAIRERFAL